MIQNETKVNTILNECESIISCVENVIDYSDNDDFVTKALESEEFVVIRFLAEDLQSYVVAYDDCENKSDTKEDIVNISIELYQQVKYCLEALEFQYNIDDEQILADFEYIRSSVDAVRELVNILWTKVLR